MGSVNHIVHINFSFTIGGIDLMLINIINEQVKKCRVSLYIINSHMDLELLEKIDKKVKIHLINRKPGNKNPISLLRLNYLLIKSNPDIIHCHNSNVINFIFTNVPTVLTVHDIGYNTANYKKYDKLIAISKAVHNDILASCESNNIRTIYNGVNCKAISVKNKKNYTDTEVFKIAVISRLESEKKGQDIVINAVNDILEMKDPDITITVDFIGEGNSKDDLINLSTSCGFGENFSFIGKKNYNYICGCLKNYDLVIQPSRYEGFGLTIVEAMTAKVPVLASKIDGPKEILENGKYGYIFESDNVKSLKDNILEIVELHCDTPKLLEQNVEKSYQRAISEFDVSITVNNYMNLYNEIINGENPEL